MTTFAANITQFFCYQFAIHHFFFHYDFHHGTYVWLQVDICVFLICHSTPLEPIRILLIADSSFDCNYYPLLLLMSCYLSMLFSLHLFTEFSDSIVVTALVLICGRAIHVNHRQRCCFCHLFYYIFITISVPLI